MEVKQNRPEWVTEPDALGFKVVNQPLEEVANILFSRLEIEQRQPKNFYFILNGLLTTSHQTYKAIHKLVAKDPKYPLQGHMLGRSLIDTLFTICVMKEKPVEYSKQYELAGYKVMYEEYSREFKRYNDDAKWKDYLADKKKCLDELAGLIGLSPDERMEPDKNINYWPIPSKVINPNKFAIVRVVQDKTKQFLTEVYHWRYRQCSEWHHQAWGGMSMGIFANAPQYHWLPGKFESDAVASGILFLLMILSEIETSCNYGVKQKLRYTWTILNNYYEEAKDYYNMRYDYELKED
jgi:hypothetical protein